MRCACARGRQDCQPRPNSQRQPLRLFLSNFRLQHFYMTVNVASEMHSNASRSLSQPLLDCMLYLTQYLYDPGTFTKLCKSVYPWERVSEIQSIRGTHAF